MLEKDFDSTIGELLDGLKETDTQLRMRAARALALLPAKESPEVVEALAAHLQNDADARVRLCCAVGLMTNETELVRAAYIRAASDENEKVASLACGQLGFRGGAEARDALFQTLSRPEWRIRLEACKALVTLKAADNRLVTALEEMSLEAEAKVYDDEIEKFDEMEEEIRSEVLDSPEFESWGKTGTILEQARLIAANQD
jgi:HEAT repeat protein